MKNPLSLSLLVHTVLGFLGFLIPHTQKDAQEYPKVDLVTPEKFAQVLKNSQIVRSQDGKTGVVNPKDKAYLSKTTNITKKNMVAPNTGDFKNNKTNTSELKKGKGAPAEKKGKGVSATDDFISGAAIGPMTILNTQEFKYFNYYEKIREKVVEIWRPMIKESILKVKSSPDKHGKLQVGVHTTKLLITLNSQGEVIQVSIIQKSGYDIFDLTAVKAFNKAERFAGVPKELVVNDQFQIRWDFLIEVQGANLIDFRGNYGK